MSSEKAKLREKAAKELGFRNLSELARKSGVNEGDISKISRGIIRLSNQKAHKLIEAIINRNYQKGWDYLESASQLAEVLNFLLSNFAYLDKKEVNLANLIDDKDVERWYFYYINDLEKAQADLNDQLELIRLSEDTQKILEYILEFLKSWKVKHDFDYLDKVQHKLNQNRLIIIPGINRGMEEGFYPLIKDIFTEIRHIAHLCGEFDLVKTMSEWLIDNSFLEKDVNTQLKAMATLAWTLTSNRERRKLHQAEKIVKEAWNIIEFNNFLDYIPANDIDTIAILCELKPRLNIRIYERSINLLSIDKFNEIIDESFRMLHKPKSFKLLDNRLKIRYKIPLNYQKGVYLYWKKSYEESIQEFDYVAECANIIGWNRVEQAAYSWLATLCREVENDDLCLNYLQKIDSMHLIKRQIIRARIYSLINSTA